MTKNGKLRTAPVQVGDNCWIGQNVVIVKGVSIGDDCVVGANSVVTKSFAAGCILAGSPARVIGQIAGTPRASDRPSSVPLSS